MFHSTQVDDLSTNTVLVACTTKQDLGFSEGTSGVPPNPQDYKGGSQSYAKQD